MAENIANNFQTTLSSGIDDVTTSIGVASATGAPSENFRIIIDSEIMLVTAVSGTTWTVTRGVESTTAATHSNGANVAHVLTAGGLNQYVSENGLLSIDQGAAQLLLRRTAVNTEDDMFDSTSLDAKWTTTSGSIDLTVMSGWLKVPSSATIQQPVPAGDWTIETELLMGDITSASFGNKVGLWLSNSATITGTQKFFWVRQPNTLTGAWDIGVETYVNGGFSAGLLGPTAIVPWNYGHWFIRIVKSGTTYAFEISGHGKAFYRWSSTSSLGITPTYFGLRADHAGFYNYFVRY